MALIHRCSRLWRNLVQRARVERELDDEVRGMFDLLVQEKIGAGMDVEAARRAATLELGQVASLKEQVRDVRAGALADALLQDVRYAWRTLIHRPATGFAAVAMLALAIGVTTAMFTMVDALLLRPEFYEPLSGVPSEAMLSVRCTGTCPGAALIRQRIAAGHPAIQIVNVRALDDVYFEQLARPRASAALGVAFAGMAVLAAAGGLFSVLSYAVARRRREFGIRTALGASPAQIGRLVLRDGTAVALTGLAIGALGVWSLARALMSLQYGVTMSDPHTWFIVIGLLALTIAAASWRPARHAMLVDPVLLLREE
jgi:hypothetical protein